jgi:hypothetical protein
VHVLGARVRGIDTPAGGTGVPGVDRAIELHARIPAHPGSLGDHAQDLAGLVCGSRHAVEDVPCLPDVVVLDSAHEGVGNAHRIVGVLKEDRAVGGTVQRAVVAGVDEGPRLPLLFLLAAYELDDVGMIDVQHHHLRRPSRLATRLDHPRRGVGRPHERHWAGCRSTPRELLARRADWREIHARPRPALEYDSFVPVPAENRLHRVVDAQDETRRALRMCLDADVEPHRAVEGRSLLHQQVGQLGRERIGVRRGRKIALPFAPRPDGAHDAPHELANAVLSLRAAERAAEVFRHDHTGGQLRPPARDLDVVLLEYDVAALPRDDRRPQFPLHRIERVLIHGGEEAAERQPAAGRRERIRCLCLTFVPSPPRPFRHPLTPVSWCGRVDTTPYMVLSRNFNAISKFLASCDPAI